MNFVFRRSILAIEERPLPVFDLFGKGEFWEDAALTALEGNSAALKEGTVSDFPLALATKESKPEIYRGRNTKIIFAENVEISHLQHRIRANVMKAKTQPLHQGAEEQRTWGLESALDMFREDHYFAWLRIRDSLLTGRSPFTLFLWWEKATGS